MGTSSNVSVTLPSAAVAWAAALQGASREMPQYGQIPH
jgi:hypothetical protein